MEATPKTARALRVTVREVAHPVRGAASVGQGRQRRSLGRRKPIGVGVDHNTSTRRVRAYSPTTNHPKPRPDAQLPRSDRKLTSIRPIDAALPST
jgi:hypothetical protein